MDYVLGDVPESWRVALGPAASSETLASIQACIAERSAGRTILPVPDRVFAALEATPVDKVRAVILGQDPYPDARYATGLAFSVPDGVDKLPRSLQNIRLELTADCRQPLPGGGSLEPWTRQGVLLLNTVLTVSEGIPGSHRKCGWECVTKAIMDAVAKRELPVVFLLWGRHAQATAKPLLKDHPQHIVLCAAHPSPRSARRGFFDAKPFSRANHALRELGQNPIDWRL